MKAVTLIFFNHIFNFDSSVFKRIYHLVTFGFIYSWIISTRSHKQRHFYLICMEYG